MAQLPAYCESIVLMKNEGSDILEPSLYILLKHDYF